MVSKASYNTAHFSADRQWHEDGGNPRELWSRWFWATAGEGLGGGCGGAAARDGLKGDHSQRAGRGCCPEGARVVND